MLEQFKMCILGNNGNVEHTCVFLIILCVFPLLLSVTEILFGSVVTCCAVLIMQPLSNPFSFAVITKDHKKF